MSHAAIQQKPGVAHHFDDAAQQHAAASLGMWTFLITEVMFFGGMIAAFIVYRTFMPRGFADASAHLDQWVGAVNTAVLLCSSLTMALAVHAAQLRNSRVLAKLLLATIGLACVFLGVKFWEYGHKFQEGLVPGAGFDPHHVFTAEPAASQMFLVFYFTMTGVHALHMLIGIGVMLAILRPAWRGRFNDNPNFIEMTGLYWHFVDIVWIFLFPLLYLGFHH